MGILRSARYNCLEAQQNGVKNQYKRIGAVAWLKLKYHLLFCAICRRFLKDTKKLDSLLGDHLHEMTEQPPYSLSSEEKEQIKNSLFK